MIKSTHKKRNAVGSLSDSDRSREERALKEKIHQPWLWRILNFINPLRDPSLTVAAVLTFIEEAGQHDAWYLIIVIALVNWLAVRGIVWLVVNFTFATTFIMRRVWWGIRNPHLAWRILDAIGHEEIVIGGLPSLPEGMLLPDGSTLVNLAALGASGIQIIGELPAGTDIPMLHMPNGQMTPDSAALMGATGIFPAAASGWANSDIYYGSNAGFPQSTDNFTRSRNTDGLPPVVQQRPSTEEEQLRQQVVAYSRLLDDWIQFTEEKWRVISDSQLGWKPLRGRWHGWDDIFQDAYAAKTSDPMAQASQAASEVTTRRFEVSREKGSAASAVACFLRDMMILRHELETVQSSAERISETPSVQPAVHPTSTQFSRGNGLLRNGFANSSPRNTLIRRPTQIFVDADTDM